MDKKELEQILKEYAEENNIREVNVHIMNLYRGKKKVDVNVRR